MTDRVAMQCKVITVYLERKPQPMPIFNKASLAKLETCHPDLQTVMHEAIKVTDFTVIYGTRTIAEQQKLYAQGRTEKGAIVTHVDGVKKKSKHNYTPSLAVDVAPYPIDWKDIQRFKDLGKLVLEIATKLKAEGKITSDIVWGGNWKSFKDYPHFEIK